MYSILLPWLLTLHLPVKADMTPGADRDTAPSFAVTTTKNAIMHLRDIHRIGRNGQLPEVTAEEERIRQAFGKAVPRVSFNRTVFRQMLIRWVTACNIPFRAVESDTFRLLLGYLAACVSSCYALSARFSVLTGHILIVGQLHRNSQAHADHREDSQSLDPREIYVFTRRTPHGTRQRTSGNPHLL